jgi:hypothetical protein
MSIIQTGNPDRGNEPVAMIRTNGKTMQVRLGIVSYSRLVGIACGANIF